MDNPWKGNWKERIMAKRRTSLEARGERLATNEKDNVQWAKENDGRGGIVFVSEEAKKELNGT